MHYAYRCRVPSFFWLLPRWAEKILDSFLKYYNVAIDSNVNVVDFVFAGDKNSSLHDLMITFMNFLFRQWLLNNVCFKKLHTETMASCCFVLTIWGSQLKFFIKFSNLNRRTCKMKYICAVLKRRDCFNKSMS